MPDSTTVSGANYLSLAEVQVFGGQMNMTYTYPQPTHNNGKITMENDLIGGEQVNYTYDSLNRLISAITTGTTWGQGYNHDPFGNLTAKTILYGSVPTMSVGVDAATNQLIGLSYDANSNQASSPTASGTTANQRRLLLSGVRFGKRIWAKTLSAKSYFF